MGTEVCSQPPPPPEQPKLTKAQRRLIDKVREQEKTNFYSFMDPVEVNDEKS